MTRKRQPVELTEAEILLQDQAADYRAQGWNFRTIQTKLDFPNFAAAVDAVTQSNIRNHPHRELSVVKREELEKLDARERRLHDVLAHEHILVQWGKIVYDKEGEAVKDDSIVIQVDRQLNAIAVRRAHLLGLDAPKKRTLWEVTDEVLDHLIETSEQELAAAQHEARGIAIVRGDTE